MIVIKKATRKDLGLLSSLLLKHLEDKESEVYEENVVKFGIPESYVREALAEDTLLKASLNGKATFYLAVQDDEIIGFAETVQQCADTTVLDRIMVLPKHRRKGVGTKLLNKAIEDVKQKGMKSIIVQAGKHEEHARRFYEKNGFRKMREEVFEAPWGKRVELVTYELRLN